MTLVDEMAQYFADRIPEGWFCGPIEVCVDREELLVTGTLLDDHPVGPFREETREHRVRIAEEAEARWSRKVSWAVVTGGETVRFTTASVPVMTRLRIDERRVLDTLIAGGIARSRSEALAWCVRYVAEKEDAWLDEMRTAAASMAAIRDRGPTTT